MNTNNQSKVNDSNATPEDEDVVVVVGEESQQNCVDCGEEVQREGEELVKLARKLRHEDPVSREPGCHPVGTGVGAVVGGASVGAAAGTLLGPAGTLLGTVVGAVVGGLAGKSIQEELDPTVELVFWKGAYHTRHYFDPNRPFEHYAYAYRLGVEHFDKSHGASFAEAEPAMKRKWEDLQVWEDEGGAPPMSWEEARLAAQDSYERLQNKDRE